MSGHASTGEMRRIDDMGRIVVPKGVRSLLHVSGGDIVEFFVDNDGAVFIQKVNHTSFMSHEAKACLNDLFHLMDAPGVVCNLRSVVAVSGPDLAMLEGTEIDTSVPAVIGNSAYCRAAGETIMLIKGNPQTLIDCSAPLLAGGHLCGMVVVFASDGIFTDQNDKKLCAKLIASILNNWHGEKEHGQNCKG